MAIKASATITLSFMVDVKATYRYYKLQASTATAPSKPTAYPPSGWTTTEPSYTTGSTNTLYFVDCTVFTNNTFNYSAVSVSSAYEAAKEAFNKAIAAGNTANSANDKIDNLQIGGRNLILKTSIMPGVFVTDTSGYSSKGTVSYQTDGSALVTNNSTNFRFCGPAFTVASGEVYTISAYYKYVSGTQAHQFEVTNNANGSAFIGAIDVDEYLNETREDIGDGWIKTYRTFTVPTGITSIKIWFRSGKDYNAYTHSYYIKHPKLEKGNKATDWTPAPEDVDSAINAKIASVDVEYYLSTSATSLSGGSWQTTAPTWVNGKYMWSRTKITNGAGTVTYKPSETGTCIAGAKGDTGPKGNDGTLSWTPVLDGVTRNGSTFTKTGGSANSWNAQVYSKESFATGCYASSQISSTSGHAMFGLNADPTTNNSFDSIDYAFYFNTGAVAIYENGEVVYNNANLKYTTSSVAKVIYDGNNVYYYLDSALLRTVARSVTTPLYLDSSIYTSNLAFVNLVFGATGATGTGISSITEEYYLSTSKTSQTGGSWTTTPPTWSSGKYIWTRSKIVYTNPSSTVYTTPICDSSWEAVNEVQVGGRNLIVGSSTATVNSNWSMNGWGGSFITYDSYGRTYKLVAVSGWHVAKYKLDSSYAGKTLTLSLKAEKVESETTATESSYLWYTNATGGNPYVTGYFETKSTEETETGTLYSLFCTVVLNSDAQIGIGSFCAPEGKGLQSVWLIKDIKLELGNKATDWTPAPEDVDEKIDSIQVGGRNLLLKTKDYSDWIGRNGTTIGVLENDVGETSILQVTTNGSSNGDVMLKYSGVTKNEKHLLSFYARNISDNQTISFEPYGGPVYSVQATAEWKKFEVEIIPNADTEHYFFFHNKNNVSIFQLKNVKLELGTKATDWTPAPEDVESAIDDAKNEAAKTATNYIYYDTTSGLQIGDKSSGEWSGTRAQITSDSYNILNQNGTELASFGANEVRLGNESENATISMRKGSLNISNVSKGSFDYTQIGCKGNFDVSSNNYTSDTQYKKGGMLTTVETKNLIEWQNLPSTTWRALSSYTWNDLNGPAFVSQRGTYFETRLYSEENDYSTENITNGSRISLMSSKEESTNKLKSEMELSSDKINLNGETEFNGKVILSYMMPVGYIFQWVPTNGGPDLSTADKVAAYYGFGTWEEVSGRFLLGRSGSYGVGSTGGNETHTHTNPSTGSWNGTSGNWGGTSGSTAITVAQMPSHSHGLEGMMLGGWGGWPWQSWPAYVFNWGDTVFKNSNASTYNGPGSRSTCGMYIYNNGGSQGHDHSIPSHNHSIPSHSHSMGNTGATNSMPPYLSVYIWKRIA